MSRITCVILRRMDERAQSHIQERARVFAQAMAERDLEAVRRMCGPDLWERSAAGEYESLLPHVARAEALGVLWRRSLMLVETPGWDHPHAVFEHLWSDGSPALVEDQRMFTLVDRTELERTGDAERLARLRTKLDAQEAATRFVEALRSHDEERASAAFDPSLARWSEHNARTPVHAIREAELIGSVGPRTLVRVKGEGDRTVEYLWRRADGGMLIAGARVFEPA